MAKKQNKSIKSGTNKKESPKSENSLLKYLMPSLLLLLVFFITTFNISGDDDIFWHLETGKYITTQKVVPSTDVFTFEAAGQEWIPFEWGFDVLSYNIFYITGYTGLSVFRSLIFIFVFYLFLRFAEKMKINKVITYFILLLLVIALFERFLLKPQIISYLFTALILYIFLSLIYIKREGVRLIYFLPLIFLIWANMHMGVISGIALFTIFLISEIAAYFKPVYNISGNTISNGYLKTIVLLYIASIAALLINPHGIHTYTYVYSHLNMKMLEDVFEWRSPFNKVFEGSMYIYVYYLFIAGGLASVYYFFKNINIFSFLTALVFLLLSFRSARFSIDFMLVSSILLIIALNSLLLSGNKYLLLQKPVLKYVLIVIMAGIIASLPASSIYKYFNFDRVTGFGIDKAAYPQSAVNFIRINNITSIGNKPFNTFDCGGYLIWEIPGAMNFIDSRNLSDEIYYRYKTINNKEYGFESKFESYGFDYILWSFPKLPWNNTEMKTSIISYLIKNNEKWKLVYWDDVSFVFVRNDDRFKDIIEKNEYRYVNPYYYIFDKEPLKEATYSAPERITEEIKRNYSLNPDGVFIRAMAKSFNVNP